MNGKRIWRITHRWVGLVLGTALALIGLTGAISAYQREIDAALNPSLFTPGEGPARIGAEEAMATARALAPAAQIRLVRLPDPVWPVFTVNQFRRTDDGQRLWMVHVDPASGRVLGEREFEASFARTVNRLHSTLLLRQWWGRELVGIAGIFGLFSIASGIWLWWPRSQFRQALTQLRRRPRQLFYLDLHSLVGIWLMIPLVVITFTGVWKALPSVVRPAVNLMTETRERAPGIPGRPSPNPPIGAARAQAIAEAAIPGAQAGIVAPPGPRRNSWEIGLRGVDGDPRIRNRSLVWVNPQTGEVMGMLGEGHGPLGARMEKDLLWLHSGVLFGGPGQFIGLLAGLSLPALWVSGLLLWLRKRRIRQRSPVMAGARAAVG
ncbi:PepSY domain-containing protein [Rhodovarius crocodyli]|uniref:PepSY domain-containing protein n=1 Tax=Rhodovarius crocodyli TaxID=1979269 RepID=A0A437MEE3_9PROT|nr:PepSY-associated TM helix domain-containing protein [Rhodovarius crocodyli]RVT96043.1 PepSY domain-containing protein [Rhodovarius crocodyli]